MYNFEIGKRKHGKTASDALSMCSHGSRLSTNYLAELREQLRTQIHQPSTRKNYHCVWKNFNKFIIKLDNIPSAWEERTSLYCAFLTEYSTIQSRTLKSYVSAIKYKVTSDYGNYKWNDGLVHLSSLTKACKIKNDEIRCRLPISNKFLECILFQLERYYGTKLRNNKLFNNTRINTTLYDKFLYRTAFLIAYHGLMRIGEITTSEHVVKATDVHIARNRSVLMILRSSKTHTKGMKPQRVEIKATPGEKFCPVQETQNYSSIRPGYKSEEEPFFVFSDRTPLQAQDVRNLLRKLIQDLHLNSALYDTHSFRIGRANGLFHKGMNVEQIKHKGRWQSNAVYKYLKH